MKERPIIFSGPMVRAILEGRKTQTRRIVKPQPSEYAGGVHPKNKPRHDAPYFDSYCNEKKTASNPRGMSQHWCWWSEDDRQGPDWIKCHYGQPGDRLWVRETFSYYEHPELYDCIRYKVDGHCQKPDFGKMTEAQCGCFEMHCDGCGCADHRWRSPIHMPRWASRITLEITDIRVERLQDISEADAQAEGVTESIVLPGDRGSFVASFGYLWESIHGAGSWAANPWVWVIEFERVKGGEG